MRWRIGAIAARSIVLTLLASAVARPAAAQGRWSAAFELAGGNALGYGGGGTYDSDRRYPVFRAALGARFAVTRRIGIFADLDAENIGLDTGDKVSVGQASCCRTQSFPQFTGYLLAVGVSVRPLSAVEFRAGIGPGLYKGKFVDQIYFGTAEITVDVLPYVGISAAVRDMFYSVYGERFRTVPVTIGIRIH